MQHFKTLLKKEFSAYFSGYSAYFLIFVYLFISFGGAFYLKNYLAAKDNAVLSLFALQPYILAILIPAVTMKLWSEEYKSNSAEFLLTLPINLNAIIGAKFCAAALFCIMLSLGLLPFIIYTSFVLQTDFLNIICAYLGLWSLIVFFCALGVLCSAVSTNLIVSYALSIFIFLMAVIIPQTNLVIFYQDFLFAEIGMVDIFYFVSFAVLFLYFNKMVVDAKRKAHKISAISAFLLIAAAIIANSLLCWATNAVDYKLDLTSKRIYTLKKQSKEIVSQIKKPLEINVYIAQDYLNNDYAIAYYFEQLSRFLQKYKSLSKGMIKVNQHQVKAFSEEETNLLKKELYAIGNTSGSKNYFGAIIKSAENEEVITAFLPQRQNYLEEDIDRALLKVAFPELKKSIGVFFDAEQNLNDYEGAGLIWENEYNTDLLDNTTYQINKDATAVIMVNPKMLSPVFLYALDQYVMNGGNLLIFADRKSENQLDDINDSPIFLERLLNHWGIELSDEVYDEGLAVGQFNNSPYPLKMKSACLLKVNNDDLNITPLIKSENGLLGAVFEGEFTSFYKKNPFLETQIGVLMHPFKAKAKRGRVAVVCDADILDENNWIAANSPDRNIFGTLENAGNGRFITSLVDYMTENYIYAVLPKNEKLKNILSIGDKIELQTRKADEKEYEELKNDADSLVPLLWQLADYDAENMPTILNLTDVGRQLQELNEQINNIDYERTKRYNSHINHLMFITIIALPLCETLFVLTVVLLLARKRNKKIKGLMNG